MKKLLIGLSLVSVIGVGSVGAMMENDQISENQPHQTSIIMQQITESEQNILMDLTQQDSFEDVQKFLANTTEISVTRRKVTDEDVMVLAKILVQNQFPNIKIINLSRNKISNEGAIALAQTIGSGATPSLELLILTDNNIEYEGAEALVIASTTLNKLTLLNLKKNRNLWQGEDSLNSKFGVQSNRRTLMLK